MSSGRGVGSIVGAGVKVRPGMPSREALDGDVLGCIGSSASSVYLLACRSDSVFSGMLSHGSSDAACRVRLGRLVGWYVAYPSGTVSRLLL